MLNQINHWMEYAAAGVDLVLLLRVLGLRLQRVYVFLTLACAVTVIFDAANMFYGQEAPRVEIYSELFAACIFPLAAWDVFEEIAASVSALRRLAMLRTLASFIIISFFGLAFLPSLSERDDPTGLIFLQFIALTVSTASAGSCLGFLWIMHRGMGMQRVAARKNTIVWMLFFGLLMAGQLLVWFELIVMEFVAEGARANFSTAATILLNFYGLVITLWCAAKLRGVAKDIPAPVSETEPGP